MGLERLHSKHVLHFFYMIGTIALEIFLGVRTGIMYQQVLVERTHAELGEVIAVQILSTIAVSVIGCILAIWRHQALAAAFTRIEAMDIRNSEKDKMRTWAQWSMWIVIAMIVAHEVAAIMWMMWGNSGFDSNIISIMIVFGMTCLSLSPFFLGIFTSSIGEILNEERKQRLTKEAGDLRDGLQIRAMRSYVKETRTGMKRGNVKPTDVLSDDTRQYLTGPVSFLDKPQPKDERGPFYGAQKSNQADLLSRDANQQNGRRI